MMTSLKFASFLTCVLLWRTAMATDVKWSVNQDNSFIPANVGQNVTLRCFLNNDPAAAMFYWYKQTLGQKPSLISIFYKHDKSGTFAEEYKNDSRFSLETKKGVFHLTILDLHTSDSATYYCTSLISYKLEFGKGATVSVKGSGLNLPVSVHPFVSSSIQRAGFVTLNCTIHSKSCDGEHSVYWFSEPHLGIVYNVGGRNDQCERKPETQTHSCVYNLPTSSLNVFHAATYHCAVASCGHILFENGPKSDSEEHEHSLLLVLFLSGALVFTVVLSVVLIVSVYKIKKANSCKCTGFKLSSGRATSEGDQDEDGIHYAALREHRITRATRQGDDSLSHCVYSTVK